MKRSSPAEGRDLRLNVKRHLVTAGQSAAGDRDACAVDDSSIRSYGESGKWW